jgi:hypothetical protein
MQTLRRKTESEYLQLRPYRAIAAPKLRSQKERDQIAYGARGLAPGGLTVKNPRSSRATNRIPYLVVTALVTILGLLWLFHFL